MFSVPVAEVTMNEFFSDLARRFEAAGITAEAVEDAKGRPCALQPARAGFPGRKEKRSAP